MLYIPSDGIGRARLELTRRNLEVLLKKLDDDGSAKTLGDPDGYLWVTAVENEAHYSDRPPGPMYMPTSGETI